MNIDKDKNDYDSAGIKFNQYLDNFGGPAELKERIIKIHNYLKENNLEILAFTFKQAQPLVSTILEKETSREDTEKITLVMHSLLVLLDSMVHAGYITENFLPDELRIENSPRVIVKISKEIVEKVKKDNKKKNGKK